MSTLQWLKERQGPRVRLWDVDLVASGSPVRLRLKAMTTTINTPKAVLVLARRHLPLAKGHAVLTRLLNNGTAVVEVPMLEDMAVLRAELEGTGIQVTRSLPLPVPNIGALRSKLGLSQEDFALEFGLEVASVRNWEQGRSEPDAATRTVLMTIAVHPEAVREALAKYAESDEDEASFAL